MVNKIIILSLSLFLVVGCTGVKAPVEGPSLCSDTDDGIDVSVRGECHDKYYMVEDSCASLGTKVKEYYCDGDYCDSEIIDCDNGCGNGICISGCTDSDNGINLNIKGTVTVDGKEYSDICHSSGKRIMEYYCLNEEKAVIDKACSIYETCEDGACVKK